MTTDKSRTAPFPRLAACACLMLATALAGCGAKPRVQPDAATASQVPAQRGDDVATVVHDESDNLAGLSAQERAALDSLQREGMVVYFEYDSARLSNEATALLASHARFASRFSPLAIRLEGHTDERGSREYNIGLGERRAQAVKVALELQGIQSSRIATVSYGEERPAASGPGETNWSRNRRVEIRYTR